MWPLVFVWRHQLEIALKYLVAFGRVMKGEPWSFAPQGKKQPNHQLFPLWTEVREVILRSGDVPSGDELDEVGRRVDEFDKMDPDSFGFRYTTNRSNTERALSEPPTSINLGDFHEAMVEVSYFLKAAHDILFERHQRGLEQQLELEQSQSNCTRADRDPS